MSVGGIRGGGGRGGPKGPRGAGGPNGAAKTGGGGFGGKIDRQAPAHGAVSTTGVAGAAAADPITSQALAIVRQLKAGEIGSRDEATKRLVSAVLKEKLRMRSHALTNKIAQALQDDPRLSQRLEKLWSQEPDET